jgi:acyl carrier protein
MLTIAIQEMQIQILDKVKSILNYEDEVPLDADLANLGLDSIKFISLSVELENFYNITFDDDELLYESFSTVNNIVERITPKIVK